METTIPQCSVTSPLSSDALPLSEVRQQDEQRQDATGAFDKASDSIPIRSSKEIVIRDITTNFIAAEFSDTHFILITQFDKIGSLVHAKQSDVNSAVFDIDVLFGDRGKDIYEVYARCLMERLTRGKERSSGGQKPLLLSIALKDESPEAFKEIMQSIDSLIQD